MPNYQKAKIYKLWSPSKNLVYYGSTTQLLCQRLAHHQQDYNKFKNNNYHYVTAFKILECEDYKIELVENYPCNNKEQLARKEGEYMKNNECVNKCIAGRTDKEYYEDNKEKLLEYSKKYAESHKEDKAEYDKKYYEDNKEKKREYHKNYMREYRKLQN